MLWDSTREWAPTMTTESSPKNSSRPLIWCQISARMLSISNSRSSYRFSRSAISIARCKMKKWRRQIMRFWGDSSWSVWLIRLLVSKLKSNRLRNPWLPLSSIISVICSISSLRRALTSLALQPKPRTTTRITKKSMARVFSDSCRMLQPLKWTLNFITI